MGSDQIRSVVGGIGDGDGERVGCGKRRIVSRIKWYPSLSVSSPCRSFSLSFIPLVRRSGRTPGDPLFLPRVSFASRTYTRSWFAIVHETASMHTCMSPYLIGLIELRVKTVSAKQSIHLPDKRLSLSIFVSAGERLLPSGIVGLRQTSWNGLERTRECVGCIPF